MTQSLVQCAWGHGQLLWGVWLLPIVLTGPLFSVKRLNSSFPEKLSGYEALRAPRRQSLLRSAALRCALVPAATPRMKGLRQREGARSVAKRSGAATGGGGPQGSPDPETSSHKPAA